MLECPGRGELGYDHLDGTGSWVGLLWAAWQSWELGGMGWHGMAIRFKMGGFVRYWLRHQTVLNWIGLDYVALVGMDRVELCT